MIGPQMSIDITAPVETAKPPRERLIEAATELFCRFGINAIGVDAVVARAGTAKATLYKLFGSKENLVEAVLEREGCAWRNWLLNGMEASGSTPATRLRSIFPLLAEWFSRDHFYGCPFINAIAEHDKHNDRLRTIAMTHKKVVLGRIEDLAREAGSLRPEHFAHQIGIIIDGAIVAAMVTRDPGVALLAGEAAEPLFAGLSRAGSRKRSRNG
jgi:AcrR family transcriptional regulator